MIETKWLNLQLFGGEGASGGDGSGSAGDGGTTTAETAETADFAEQRLRELGVPEDKIRKRAKKTDAPIYNISRKVPEKKEEANPVEAQDAAAKDIPAEENKPSQMSWDEFMAIPENNKRMQETVQGRLKSAKSAEDNLAKLAPALEILARHHNLDVDNLDYEAIAKAVSEDRNYYEQKALDMGVSVETAMKIDQFERDSERRKKEETRTLEQQRTREHLTKLISQGEELKKMYPNFDLKTELQNPDFAKMTSPGMNLSVETAYEAVHRKEIREATMKAAREKAEQSITQAIQSGARRPAEAGTSGQAPSVTTFDYRTASPEQREAFKAKLRQGFARGEKMYPGQIKI